MSDLRHQLYMWLIGDRIAARRYMRQLEREIAECKAGTRERITVEFPSFD